MIGAARKPALLVTLLVGGLLLVAACSGTGGPGGAGAGRDLEADTTWRTEPLTDVRTGATFTVDELRGKVVVVQPMAIWCVSCRIQQAEARAALEAIGSEDLAFIGIGVDPNETAEALARYATEYGFDWAYAVAPRDTARALVSAFGPQVLSTPSTPMIVLDPGGTVVDVHFGIRGPRELEALWRGFLP